MNRDFFSHRSVTGDYRGECRPTNDGFLVVPFSLVLGAAALGSLGARCLGASVCQHPNIACSRGVCRCADGFFEKSGACG